MEQFSRRRLRTRRHARGGLPQGSVFLRQRVSVWCSMSEGAEHTRTATTARSTTLLVRSATLSIVKGRDAGHSVKIESPSFTIGTGSSADLRLVDPAVSREHVQIGLLPNGVRLRDRSKN